MPLESQLNTSAPGRICLFGEHQDYLGLPVIPAAIDLRIKISIELQGQPSIELALPDIQSAESFSIQEEAQYGKERDYLRSVFNQFFRAGYALPSGIRGAVHGTIPINAGTASSSALCVAWARALMELVDYPGKKDPLQVAKLAHQAEVLEFMEPGGMMDHYIAALGGVQHIQFVPQITVEPLPPISGTFVLGDSGEPKDTIGILSRVKEGTLRAVNKIKERVPGFDLAACHLEEMDKLHKEISEEEFVLLQGAVLNRDINSEARRLFLSGQMSPEKLGSLLNDHQRVLRDDQRISTPKIDRMLDAALEAGALGGKINGSGGGGCMFVFAPQEAQSVAEAIRKVGGIPHIVRVDEGVRVD